MPNGKQRVHNTQEVLIGLALILAIANPNGVGTDGVAPFAARCRDGTSGTPYLVYATSLLNSRAESSEPLVSMLNKDDDEDELDAQYRRGDNDSIDGVVVSSGGETDSGTYNSAPRTPEPELHASGSSLAHVVVDSKVMQRILSFSTGRDLTAMRGVSKELLQATRPFMTFHEPTQSMFFHWSGKTPAGQSKLTKGLHGRDAEAALRSALLWQCSSCLHWNASSKEQCACNGQRAPRDANAQRAFVGQLRKEKTAEYVTWLVGMLCPEVELLHIENHTSKEGRGKGCAWVYTRTVGDHVKLLQLHKRVYCDGDCHHEGVYVCRNDKDSLSILEQFALERSFVPSRPRNILPKKTLVVELPNSEIDPVHCDGYNTPPFYQPYRYQSRAEPHRPCYGYQHTPYSNAAYEYTYFTQEQPQAQEYAAHFPPEGYGYRYDTYVDPRSPHYSPYQNYHQSNCTQSQYGSYY